MIYFTTFKEWLGCIWCAASHVLIALRLTIRFLFVGIISLFRALWRLLVKGVGRYPSLAVGAFVAAVFFTWLLTFAAMRARAVGAEDKCSAVMYEFETFKSQHGYK